jgi:hypothetical protein
MLLPRTSLGIALLLGGIPAFGDTITTGAVDQYGTAIAEGFIYALSMQPGGVSGPASCLEGCGGSNSHSAFTGNGVWANDTYSTAQESRSGTYTGGNPPTAPLNQTALLGPGNNSVSIQDLTMTLWDNRTGALVWQSGNLLPGGNTFPSPDPGVGQSGHPYALSGTQTQQPGGLIANYGAGQDPLRIEIFALVTGAGAGPDSLYGGTPTVNTPEPSTILLLGIALLPLGLASKRIVHKQAPRLR